MQFTLEAIILTAIGGIFGILLGAAVVWLIPAVWPLCRHECPPSGPRWV